MAPDLKALWVSLGVKSSKSDQIAFDEGAPLVQIRRDMTARAAPPAIAITKP